MKKAQASPELELAAQVVAVSSMAAVTIATEARLGTRKDTYRAEVFKNKSSIRILSAAKNVLKSQ